MATDGAYVGHDGRLVALCWCGAQFHGETDKPALVALLEHQRTTCKTAHPGGAASGGAGNEG